MHKQIHGIITYIGIVLLVMMFAKPVEDLMHGLTGIDGDIMGGLFAVVLALYMRRLYE